MRNNKGIADLLVIIVVTLIVGVVGVVSYLFLTGQSEKIPFSNLGNTEIKSSPSPIPVSDSDEVKDIEAELETTVVGDPNADIEEIDTSSDSL